MKKSKIQDITISFQDSMSSEGVTGSRVYVESEKKILLECGLHYAHSPLETYKINSMPFKFKVKELNYVFLCHSHADHCATTPLLYKRGCQAKLIIPVGNTSILYKMLSNSAMIMNGDAEMLSKKLNKTVEPLYTQDDVDLMMKYIVEFDFNQEIKLDDSTSFQFIHSGHLVSSASLLLKLRKGQTYKTIYYTSDLGNITYKNYYTEPLDRIKNADIVISECTYGNKDRSCSNKDQREKDIERLKTVVSQYCIEQKGKVLIPVFSLHRGQQMATILYEIYSNDKNFDIPIYMDSILLAEITKIFRNMFPEFEKVMQWDKIKVIDKKIRKELTESNKPMIILSSSGMVTNGASLTWLKSMVTKPNNCIVFVGYCDVNTLGYKLKLKDQKTITIQGQQFKNKIQVGKLKSFSGHIQHQDLLSYLSEINCQTVLLHHGNTDDRINFKADLEVEYAKKCKSTQVKVVNKSTKIHI